MQISQSPLGGPSNGCATEPFAIDLPRQIFESLVNAWSRVLVADFRRRHSRENDCESETLGPVEHPVGHAR
jgi:hypothetical protein